MTKNPFYNAIAASMYIIVIVFTMNIVFEMETNTGIAAFITPIIMLSLFTLSVAVMGYIFFYQPVLLFLEGEKEKAIKLFLKTIGIFGILTFSLFAIYILLNNFSF